MKIDKKNDTIVVERIVETAEDLACIYDEDTYSYVKTKWYDIVTHELTDIGELITQGYSIVDAKVACSFATRIRLDHTILILKQQ